MVKKACTDNKTACISVAVLFWGIIYLLDMQFICELLLKIFPLELLQEYIEVVFYGGFFIAMLIVFRGVLLDDLKYFIANRNKCFSLCAGFFIVTLVLMVASAIILDSNGIGNSENQEGIDSLLEQYGILQLVTVCVIGPVVEEICYRGIFFSFINGKNKTSLFRGIAAVILTALFFAFNHVSADMTVYDILANIPIFMLGLTLSTLYLKTDNIYCPILVHIAINTMASL